METFANLVAAHEREKLAKWMIERGYATGHGDSVEDLLKELEWQVAEQRQWQTLDDAEYQEILAKLGDGGLLAFYILIEAKLREKNT